MKYPERPGKINSTFMVFCDLCQHTITHAPTYLEASIHFTEHLDQAHEGWNHGIKPGDVVKFVENGWVKYCIFGYTWTNPDGATKATPEEEALIGPQLKKKVKNCQHCEMPSDKNEQICRHCGGFVEGNSFKEDTP